MEDESVGAICRDPAVSAKERVLRIERAGQDIIRIAEAAAVLVRRDGAYD
jgi:hypothetical protein